MKHTNLFKSHTHQRSSNILKLGVEIRLPSDSISLPWNNCSYNFFFFFHQNNFLSNNEKEKQTCCIYDSGKGVDKPRVCDESARIVKVDGLRRAVDADDGSAVAESSQTLGRLSRELGVVSGADIATMVLIKVGEPIVKIGWTRNSSGHHQRHVARIGQRRRQIGTRTQVVVSQRKLDHLFKEKEGRGKKTKGKKKKKKKEQKRANKRNCFLTWLFAFHMIKPSVSIKAPTPKKTPMTTNGVRMG